MRVNVTIYRTVKIPTEYIKGCVGLEISAKSDQAADSIKKCFGPHMAPGFKIFWPEPAEFKSTIVGMEALGFDAPVPTQIPQAANALTLCDPIDSEDTHRIDGALRSELMRMGIPTETDDYEWRIETKVKP
jgi:hypothetical protein